MLQQVAYGLLEWVSRQSPEAAQQPDPNTLLALRAPTDGLIVDAVESLIISAEQLGWAGVSLILTREVPEDRNATRVCGNNPATAIGLLRGLISIRNAGAEGHGLIGGYDRDAELDALAFVAETFQELLPEKDSEGGLFYGPSRNRQQLQFLRVWDGDCPALIRRIKILAADKVRAYCQMIPKDGGARAEFNYDAPNPFQNLSGRAMPQASVWDNGWAPSCAIPERMTDSFTGRRSQLADLAEWFADSDSRSCLIFGDGGLGKTTLVVEFLHQVLDEELPVVWYPKVVIFYTAKRWQWGLNGLEPVSAGRPHLLELLAHIHVILFAEFPAQSFYRAEFPEAVANLQTKVRQRLDYGRDDILIVVDNAETLINSEAERNQLGKELKQVGRRLGRVIITSRRREIIEAAPISLEPLNDDEAVELLRDRAEKLGIKSVQRATDDELHAAVKKLERRPIVLEALIQALIDPGVRKIEQAVAKVAEMLRRDLGEFLFADAWARLGPDVRRLLLLMTRIGDVHDAQSLRICAKIVGVSPQVAEQSLEESGGIASVIHSQGSLQIVFSKNFLEFARERTLPHLGGVSPSPQEIGSARSQYSEFVRNAQKFTGDRIVEAFRTPQAKAAHRARQKGEYSESRKLYAQAILTDSTNGWLFDRYAYFLFHDCRDFDAALHQAKRAVELLPTEGEPWHTRGLIEARQGDFRACEISMAKAEQFGIDPVRCAIQRCWAYIKSRPLQVGLAEKEVRKLRALTQSMAATSREHIELGRIISRLEVLKKKHPT